MSAEWFLFFFKKSIRERRGRFAISSSAVALTVLVVTALATLSLGMREKMGSELKQYGANMVITGNGGRVISNDDMRQIQALPDIAGASVRVFGAIPLNKGETVEIVGLEPQKISGYRLQGDAPRAENEVMVGTTLREQRKLNRSSEVMLGQNAEHFRISATFETGADEDAMLIMQLASAQRLLGVTGVHAILLNAVPQKIQELEIMIRKSYPHLAVKTLRQVAVAEERILSKIQMLMVFVTVVVVFASSIALGSTMGANVIERTVEIGLMKALGAVKDQLRRFFLFEAIAVGLVGAAIGCLLGILAAEMISQKAFNSFVSVHVLVAPVSLCFGVAIALLATWIPVRTAMAITPAQILRGD